MVIFVKRHIDDGKEQHKMGNGHVVKMDFFHAIQNVLQLCSCDRKCKKSFDLVFRSREIRSPKLEYVKL